MAQSGTPPPQAIHHELRTAENSAGYLLPKLAELHKANPSLKLLDVGAGSGTISATLAKAIQPGGQVTAIDIKADILPRAKAVADMAGVTNIDYQQADVLGRLPFEDSTFDVTHCHQVLAHLPRPADAIREMVRVTKPGGIIAAREGDLETECVWPDLPGMAKFHTLTAAFIRMAGGSPKAGRQLLSWALQAGVRREHVTPGLGSWCYSDPEERKIWGKWVVLLLLLTFSPSSLVEYFDAADCG
jgi:ubiquinone/menaquinone biosynthesis C-methylase UbiE